MDIFDGNFSSIPSTENIEQPQTLNGSLLDGLEEENDLVIDQPTVNVTDPVEQFVEEEQNRLGDIGLELGLGQTPKEQVDDEKASENKVEIPIGGGEFTIPDIGNADPMNEEPDFNFIHKPRDASKGEPACILEWKRKQEEKLKVKDQEEEKKKQDMRDKAKRDLEELKRKYDEEVAKRKEENRMLEEAFLKEVHGLKPGNEWDRVAKNCGFNNKIIHCKKDRNRMRNVILSMKQTVINGK